MNPADATDGAKSGTSENVNPSKHGVNRCTIDRFVKFLTLLYVRILSKILNRMNIPIYPNIPIYTKKIKQVSEKSKKIY